MGRSGECRGHMFQAERIACLIGGVERQDIVPVDEVCGDHEDEVVHGGSGRHAWRIAGWNPSSGDGSRSNSCRSWL